MSKVKTTQSGPRPNDAGQTVIWLKRAPRRAPEGVIVAPPGMAFAIAIHIAGEWAVQAGRHLSRGPIDAGMGPSSKIWRVVLVKV